MSKKGNRERAKRWYEEHKNDPEFRARKKKYMQEYNAKTKEKRREYYKKYYRERCKK